MSNNATGNNLVDQYRKTFTSFSGADIVATFAGKVIGELQQISYSVSREKAPIYTLGSANPRSFSRGKRGVAGNLVFAVFNRDALVEVLQNELRGSLGYTAGGNTVQALSEKAGSELAQKHKILAATMEDWNTATELSQDSGANPGFVQMESIQHADQLPPFTIGVNFSNEYGQQAHFELYGVEILNEGAGMSIDDVVTEKAISFVARNVTPITSGAKNNGHATDLTNKGGGSTE